MAATGGIRAGAAFIELYAKDNALVRGLNAAQAKLKAFSTGVSSLGRQMMGLSAMIAMPVGLATRTFASFSDQMSVVKAVTQAAAPDFDRLNDLAAELGRTTSFTASQVAEGMTELGRAGFEPDQIEAATASMLNLARAADTELGTAAEIAAATIRQFGLQAEDATKVADVLAATANGSAQTLSDLGESLKYVAPIAKNVGASLEDTASAMAILANNGIKGSQAGTSLARAYKNLAREDLQEQLRGVGVEAVNAAGDMRDLSTILYELGQATKNMGSAKRTSIFEGLFGRGMVAAQTLSQTGAQFDDFMQKLEQSSGVAAKTATEMDNNLGGAFRRFMSAAEGAAIAIGDALGGTLQEVLSGVTGLIGDITEFIEENESLVVSFAKLVAGIAVGGAALVALGGAASVAATAIGAISTILTTVGGIVATVIGGISALGGALAGLAGLSTFGLIAAGAGVLAAAIAGLITLTGKWGTVWEGLKEIVNRVAIVMRTSILSVPFGFLYDKASEVAGGIMSVYRKMVTGIQELFAGLAGDFESGFGSFMAQIRDGDFAGSFETAMATVEMMWHRLVTSMQKAWNEFIAATISGFNWMWDNSLGGLRKMLGLQDGVGELLKAHAKSYRIQNDLLDAKLAKKQKEFDLTMEQQEIEAKASKTRKDMKADLEKWAAQRDKEKSIREAKAIKENDARNARIDKAKADKAREKAEIAALKKELNTPVDFSEEIKKQEEFKQGKMFGLEDADPAVVEAALTGIIEDVGLDTPLSELESKARAADQARASVASRDFSAQVAYAGGSRGMFAGGITSNRPQEETAQNTRQLVAETKAIRKNTDNLEDGIVWI